MYISFMRDGCKARPVSRRAVIAVARTLSQASRPVADGGGKTDSTIFVRVIRLSPCPFRPTMLHTTFTLSLLAHNAPYKFHPVPFSPQCSIQLSPCTFQPTMLHTIFTLSLSAHNAPYKFHPVPFRYAPAYQTVICTE